MTHDMSDNFWYKSYNFGKNSDNLDFNVVSFSQKLPKSYDKVLKNFQNLLFFSIDYLV